MAREFGFASERSGIALGGWFCGGGRGAVVGMVSPGTETSGV